MQMRPPAADGLFSENADLPSHGDLAADLHARIDRIEVAVPVVPPSWIARIDDIVTRSNTIGRAIDRISAGRNDDAVGCGIDRNNAVRAAEVKPLMVLDSVRPGGFAVANLVIKKRAGGAPALVHRISKRAGSDQRATDRPNAESRIAVDGPVIEIGTQLSLDHGAIDPYA
jgi:hypothetical protein